jgi:hypothetical protein
MAIEYEPQSCNQCFVLVHPAELTHHVEAVHSGRIDDPGEVIATWLEGIDAEELERVTLERIGYSDNPTRSMLNVLAVWARGQKLDGP